VSVVDSSPFLCCISQFLLSINLCNDNNYNNLCYVILSSVECSATDIIMIFYSHRHNPNCKPHRKSEPRVSVVSFNIFISSIVSRRLIFVISEEGIIAETAVPDLQYGQWFTISVDVLVSCDYIIYH